MFDVQVNLLNSINDNFEQ